MSPASAPAPSRMALFTRSQWLPDVLGSSAAREGMTVHGAFDLDNAAREQFLTDHLRDVEQGPATGLRHVGMPKEPCLEAKD